MTAEIEEEEIPTYEELDVPSVGETPTARELQLMLKNQTKIGAIRHNQIVKSLIGIETKVSGTLEQSLKTNGRVTKLELREKFIASAIGLIFGFIGFAFPYFVSYIQAQIKITVDNSVSTALSKFDIQVEK